MSGLFIFCCQRGNSCSMSLPLKSSSDIFFCTLLTSCYNFLPSFLCSFGSCLYCYWGSNYWWCWLSMAKLTPFYFLICRWIGWICKSFLCLFFISTSHSDNLFPLLGNVCFFCHSKLFSSAWNYFCWHWVSVPVK